MTVASPKAVRVRTSDGWQDIALVGPAGPPGPPGATFPSGGDPGEVLGYVGPGANDVAWVPAGGGGGGAGMLNTQRLASTLEAYRGISSSGDPLCIDSASSVPLALTYTPTVACWWNVHYAAAVFRKDSAGYHYGQAVLTLTPADVDGIARGRTYDTQDANANTYASRHGSRLFKLAAGTAYTATVVAIFPAGGAYSYLAGQDYLYIEGMAWPV